MEESSNSIDNTMYLTAGMPELIPQISVDVPSDQSDSSNDLTCKTDFEIQVERLDLEDSFPSSLHNPHSLMFDGTNSEISEYSPYKVSLSRLEEIKKSFEDVDLTSTAKNLPKEPEELPENYVEESKHTEFKLEVSRASLVYDG